MLNGVGQILSELFRVLGLAGGRGGGEDGRGWSSLAGSPGSKETHVGCRLPLEDLTCWMLEVDYGSLAD